MFAFDDGFVRFCAVARAVGPAVAGGLLAFTFAAVAAAQSDEYLLPEDKEQPVLVYDRTGGFRMRPTIEIEPVLSVFPDGRVVAGRTSDQVGRAEMKLERDELQQMLKTCLGEHKLMDFTTESIQEAVQATGKQVLIADASSTVFTVNLRDKKSQVSVYALGFVVRSMPEVEELKHLVFIEKHLQKLHTTTVMGGREKLLAALEKANAELKAKYPDAAPMTADDAGLAHVSNEGERVVHFARTNLDDEGELVSNYRVSLTMGTDGKTSAKVSGYKR